MDRELLALAVCGALGCLVSAEAAAVLVAAVLEELVNDRIDPEGALMPGIAAGTVFGAVFMMSVLKARRP